MTIPIADPADAASLNDGVDWVVAVALGSGGTIIAVLAIAIVGLLMMGGRVPIRRGAGVVIGCFVLFGAAAIADGLLATVGRADQATIAMPAPPPAYTPAPPRAAMADPYAGASVPAQR